MCVCFAVCNVMEPPSYNVAVELPTYEEYQKSKEEEDAAQAQNTVSVPNMVLQPLKLIYESTRWLNIPLPVLT